MKIKKFYLFILVIIFTAVVFFSYKLYEKNQAMGRGQYLLNRKKAGWLSLKKNLAKKIGNFKGKVGLVVEDLSTGWVISFNEDLLIPSASLVKVPIMLSYFYAAQENKINLTDNIKFRSFKKIPRVKLSSSSSPASYFMVEELFDPMITVSDNAAANALIDLLGFDTLNGYFKKMGLKNTNLSRKMLDFKIRKEGI
jgi:beta-lactamase class A